MFEESHTNTKGGWARGSKIATAAGALFFVGLAAYSASKNYKPHGHERHVRHERVTPKTPMSFQETIRAQQVLAAADLLPVEGIDGIPGKATLNALRIFQARCGIHPTADNFGPRSEDCAKREGLLENARTVRAKREARMERVGPRIHYRTRRAEEHSRSSADDVGDVLDTAAAVTPAVAGDKTLPILLGIHILQRAIGNEGPSEERSRD